MRLPGLDVIFGLAAPAVDIFVKHAGVADLQVRDDEARVGPLRADFDAYDDPLDAAPVLAPSKNSLKRRSLPSSFGAASKRAFVLASRDSICRRNVVVGATPRM